MNKSIEQFCSNEDMKMFDAFSTEVKNTFVNLSFECLNQKNGNTNLAKKILQFTNHIDIIENHIFYKGAFDIKNENEQLLKYGACVTPLIVPKLLSGIRREFDNTLLNFPAYDRDNKNKSLNKVKQPIVYVLGGFSGLGNPGAYHAPLFRKLRKIAWKKQRKIIRNKIQTYPKKLKDNYKFEFFFGRPLYRKKGLAPVAEAWHRDVVPQKYIDRDDEVYGGWINLDSQNQYMSCLPGSHLNENLYELSSGFSQISKVLFRKLSAENYGREKLSDDNKKTIERKVKSIVKNMLKYKHVFTIPPGHMIMFPQYLIHEVVATKVKYNMYRLSIGSRLTLMDEPLFDTKEIIEKQSISRLGGGMLPPMYSANHGSLFLGIPIFKEESKKTNKNWIEILSDKLIILNNTPLMKSLHKKLKSTKKSEYKTRKKYIANMLEEYNNQDILYFPFNKLNFINSNKVATLNVFKTNPNDPKSITTLIKWSNDTMKPIAIVEKTNKKGYRYKVVERYMKSLSFYNLNKYPEYTESEKLIYKPTKLST